jgi:hypothetical protein
MDFASLQSAFITALDCKGIICQKANISSGTFTILASFSETSVSYAPETTNLRRKFSF